MKYLDYACMAVVFILAAISAMCWFGQGVNTWFWQVTTMGWIVYGFMQKFLLDKTKK